MVCLSNEHGRTTATETLVNLRQGMIAATGAITVPNERYGFYSGYKKIEGELRSTSQVVFINEVELSSTYSLYKNTTDIDTESFEYAIDGILLKYIVDNRQNDCV